MNSEDQKWVILFVLLGAMWVDVLVGQPAAAAPVKVYHVTNPAAFPPLSMPANGLVFRNGLFQTPGIDYTTSGAQFRFYPGLLGAGDVISVTGAP